MWSDIQNLVHITYIWLVIPNEVLPKDIQSRGFLRALATTLVTQKTVLKMYAIR